MSLEQACHGYRMFRHSRWCVLFSREWLVSPGDGHDDIAVSRQ